MYFWGPVAFLCFFFTTTFWVNIFAGSFVYLFYHSGLYRAKTEKEQNTKAEPATMSNNDSSEEEFTFGNETRGGGRGGSSSGDDVDDAPLSKVVQPKIKAKARPKQSDAAPAKKPKKRVQQEEEEGNNT